MEVVRVGWRERCGSGDGPRQTKRRGIVAPPATRRVASCPVKAPCAYCGYLSEASTESPAACRDCAGAPLELSLRERSGTWSGVRAALGAIPRGVGFLVSTRGTKRWLVPPALTTFAAFGALSWWLYGWAAEGIEQLQSSAGEYLPAGPAWWRATVEWLVTKTVLFALAKLTGFALAAAVGFVVMLWTFSLLYELLAGPFLDEIQGKLERRWFGRDPRDERERPSGITPAECAKLSTACAVVTLALIGASLAVAQRGATLGAALASFGVCYALVRRRPAFGAWLGWRTAIEARTLAASLQATALSGLMLAFALPVLFVPLVGYPLFALAAGFTTAISLLDIPMSRRRWGLSLRLSFLAHHAPAVLSFGAVASLVFVVPILGPLLMVPAASVGGLWLLCRLDKSCLRPRTDAWAARSRVG